MTLPSNEGAAQVPEFLGVGKASIVYRLDSARVMKQFTAKNDFLAELHCLETLGHHHNIVRHLGVAQGHELSIILEYGIPLRRHLQQNRGKIPLFTKTQWITDAVSGLRHMHSLDMGHADVGCQNMILVDDQLKIIDFEGTCYFGQDSESAYEWFSYPRPAPISIRTDLFALGCAIYEILAERIPFEDLVHFPNRQEEVAQRIEAQQFPHTCLVDFDTLIHGCWRGDYVSADEAFQSLEAIDSTGICEMNGERKETC